MIEIDAAWLAANPLPAPSGDKHEHGRVLAIGGSTGVPGAIALTGEAALRVGAGKVRLATVASAAIALGVTFPEAAVLALPEREGEIDDAAALADPIGRSDAVIVGPGMMDQAPAERLIRALAGLEAPDCAVVLDAAAVACAGSLTALLACWHGRLVLTPHVGEAASLLDREAEAIARDPADAARTAAARFGAVAVMKGEATVIADADGALLRYPGGGPGLGTGGSGDVLAGIIGGLLARGADPLVAAGWGVWLHGEAGRRLAREVGTVGFLAREILPILPGLMKSG